MSQSENYKVLFKIVPYCSFHYNEDYDSYPVGHNSRPVYLPMLALWLHMTNTKHVSFYILCSLKVVIEVDSLLNGYAEGITEVGNFGQVCSTGKQVHNMLDRCTIEITG
jgi:hypothetical protein